MHGVVLIHILAVKVWGAPSKQSSLKEGVRLLYIHLWCRLQGQQPPGERLALKALVSFVLEAVGRQSPEMARLFDFVFILLAIGKSKLLYLSKTSFNLHFAMRLTCLCVIQLTVKVTAFQNRISKGQPVCWTELFQYFTAESTEVTNQPYVSNFELQYIYL